MQHILGRDPFNLPPLVVFPHRLINEVVKVVVLQVLELSLAGREQFFADLHMGVHRATNVEQQQQLDGVAPLRSHLDIQQTGVACGVIDGAVDVQFICRTLTGEFSQTP